jgi:hypothetical protein
MANRVTSDEVFAIISSDAGIASTDDLTVFITVANDIVTTDLAGNDYTELRLANIQLYLSAHFACLKYRQSDKIIIGESEDDYRNRLNQGYRQTTYGQQAITLDTSGTLAEASKESFKAQFFTGETTRDWTNN